MYEEEIAQVFLREDLPKTLCFSEYILHLFFVFYCGIDPIFWCFFQFHIKRIEKNGYAGKAMHFEEEKICFCRKLNVMFSHQNTTIQYPTAR